MSGKANQDAGFPRIPYFFCSRCNTRRDAIDPGEVHPACEVCHNRTLVVLYEGLSEVVAREGIPPVDERPDTAEPYTQPRRRDLERRKTSLETLRILVTDLPAALDSQDTYRALLKDFNPFLREIVNLMVIERVDWRQAVAWLKPDFCLRYAKQLEEFKLWAEKCEPHGRLDNSVPAFIEPETHTSNEPLSQKNTPSTTSRAPT